MSYCGLLLAMSSVMKTFCTAATVFVGQWSYSGEVVNTTGANTFLQYCPNYFSKNPHVPNYACGPYQQAIFQRDCQLVSLPEALELFTTTTHDGSDDGTASPVITIVGDSLANQLKVAIECLAEYYAPNLHLSEQYIYSTYLRNDLPCWSQCLSDEKYLTQQKKVHQKNGHHHCEGCPHGNLTSAFEDKFAWIKLIPPSTKVLVLNGGAWYTKGSIDSDSDAVYRDTLTSIATILRQFISDGIDVYWYEIPPSLPSIDGAIQSSWERATYAKKNEFAKRVLDGTGVTYLNYTLAAVSRKTEEKTRYNTAVSLDGLHWCSPGPFAFTRTILESVLHLHVARNKGLLV